MCKLQSNTLSFVIQPINQYGPICFCVIVSVTSFPFQTILHVCVCVCACVSVCVRACVRACVCMCVCVCVCSCIGLSYIKTMCISRYVLFLLGSACTS